MTHRDVGYGRDPARALACAMRRDTPWTRTVRDVMCLRSDALPDPHYGFFFGTHALGEAWMFATTLAALLRGKADGHPILDPTPLHYTRNGAAHMADHVFFIATTLQKLVLGMRAAKPAAGAFGCISIVAPTRGLWRQVPSLWRGAPEQSDGTILRWCDSNVVLNVNSEVTLDGELFMAHHAMPLSLTIDSPITFLT